MSDRSRDHDPRGPAPRLSSVVRARRIRCRSRRHRRRVVPRSALVAIENGTVLVVARLHSAAERYQILVRIHHSALGGLRRARVVPALVEGDPAPPELVTSAYLWPRQSTAHSVFLDPLTKRPRGTPLETALVLRWGSRTPTHRITGSARRVKLRGVAALRQWTVRSVFASAFDREKIARKARAPHRPAKPLPLPRATAPSTRSRCRTRAPTRHGTADAKPLPHPRAPTRHSALGTAVQAARPRAGAATQAHF